MLRWMGSRKGRGFPDGPLDFKQVDGELTDDPLAAIDPNRGNQKIYAVSRSVQLPRVTLKNGAG